MEKGGHHFERSLAGDGVSPVRTSKTSWCNVPFCEADPTIKTAKGQTAADVCFSNDTAMKKAGANVFHNLRRTFPKRPACPPRPRDLLP